MARAGAARLIGDREMTGEKLFAAVRDLAAGAGELERMGAVARKLARPGAAARAADILEKLGMHDFD
jgi:UDP-N-acetylglucosamine--N-acetylmuramyl-(pentapeptide) pyrophosphoryl-undecaprenol N-acetylglucosamine transferase